jgi:nitrate/nitrite transporter NarK
MQTTMPTKGRLQTLLFATGGQFFQVMPWVGLPFLLPLINQDIKLTYTQAGSLSLAFMLVCATMQIPSGYLADRYSPRKLMAIALLGLMSFSILQAFTSQYWHLLVIQLGIGFFVAFVMTPSMSVFINWFSPQRRNTATTLVSVGNCLGMLAIELLFPVIISQFGTWRWTFIIFGAAGIISALLLLIYGKDPVHKSTQAQLRLAVIRQVLLHKQIWLCYGLQFIRIGIAQGIMFWLPTLLITEKQISVQVTGVILAAQAIILAVFNIFGGYLSDKFKKPTLVIGVSMIVLLITTALMVPINSMVLLVAVVVINSIFLQAYFGPLFGIAVEILGPEKTGLSNGIGMMFSNLGGLVTVYLMGVLRDTTGSFEWGFYTVCILCAIGLALTVALSFARQKTSRNQLLKV